MAQLKVLFIGDPHFKADNEAETDLMEIQIRALILEEDPDVTFVAGDMDHWHEKVSLYAHRRSIAALRSWMQVSRKLVVNIGNHDRPHNNIYPPTDEHSFNALKEWPRTLVVDTVHRCDEKSQPHPETGAVASFTMVYAPYVPIGRFADLLSTKELKPPYAGITAVWAHQEFKGAKMGAKTSEEGDPWALENPLCVSGHVHNYDQLQPNLIYGGTPIQHGYADTGDKTVSIFTFTVDGDRPIWTERRISLKIPKKIQVTLTAEQLAVYELPPQTHVKIKVTGPASMFKEVMKLDHVKKLAATHGVTIVLVDTTPGPSLPLPSEGGEFVPKVKLTLRDRLASAIKMQDTALQAAWNHNFQSI